MNNEERIQSELTMMAEGPDHLGPDLPISNPEPLPHADDVEKVLCISAIDVLGCVEDETLWPCITKMEDVTAILAELPNNSVFVKRPQAEQVASGFIQLIPYCVIIRGRELFCYRRKGSEGRLTGLFSCGVGGHINPVDGNPEDAYGAALRRELREELGLDLTDVPPAQAIIYDDSNDVGKVHLGIVHIVRIDLQQKLVFNDPALEQGVFWPVSELVMKCRVEPELYETWTQLVLKKIFS